MRIAALGRFIQMYAARIRQAHGARRLVERLARRVVARSAEHLKFRIIFHLHKHRVPARDDQTQKRWFKIPVRDIICGDVRAQMVHGHQRLATAQCEPFRIIHAHKQCADEPRRISHGDRIHHSKRHARLLERFCRHRADRFRMQAGSYFRHDAAEDFMALDLRGDHIGQYTSAVLYDCGGSLVTGAFQR